MRPTASSITARALHEPGCGVIAQVNSPSNPGAISASRYRIYGELFAELSQTRY